MTALLRHRLVALALAVVFGVFNIGIPVVIASCPMAAMMQGGRCGMCDDQDDSASARFTTGKNASCCQVTIAAERNTHEFVQAQARTHESTPQAAPSLVPFTVTHNPLPHTASVPFSSSPPVAADIPILTSSLLI